MNLCDWLTSGGEQCWTLFRFLDISATNGLFGWIELPNFRSDGREKGGGGEREIFILRVKDNYRRRRYINKVLRHFGEDRVVCSLNVLVLVH